MTASQTLSVARKKAPGKIVGNLQSLNSRWLHENFNFLTYPISSYSKTDRRD